jgi:hypothetical protein
MRGPERGLATHNGRRAVKLRISLIAIACAAATAALGMGSARAATINSYCIDGATVAVANDTPLGVLDQVQLDMYASLGGAYTINLGTGPDASLLDALGTVGYIVSPFAVPGAVFHPVASGACATAPAVTPPPADAGATATATATATPAATAAFSPVAETPGGIFLCYSKYQVDPGVWLSSQAQDLLAGGYWKPVAVPGIQSATRYGAFSLICNPGKETASAPVAAIDGSGDVYTDPSWLGRIDTYDVLG